MEHKYYAEGLGLVLTIDKEAGGREELLSVTEIPLARARRAGQAALGQDYRTSRWDRAVHVVAGEEPSSSLAATWDGREMLLFGLPWTSSTARRCYLRFYLPSCQTA